MPDGGQFTHSEQHICPECGAYLPSGDEVSGPVPEHKCEPLPDTESMRCLCDIEDLAGSPQLISKYIRLRRLVEHFRKRDSEARDALEDVINQFACWSTKHGGSHSTGGLSALEHAFGVLGWDDPHKAPKSLVCDEPGCKERSTCGTPTKDGYRRTCNKHWPQKEPTDEH